MASSQVFSFSQVRSTFQCSLVDNDAHIVDGTLPPTCSALGRLLMRMGLDGIDFVGRHDIDGMALGQLDKYVGGAVAA